jgi:isoleucyl-tRNA synthetase
MPFFVHRETGALHPRTPELLEAVARRVEAEGIEAWQRIEPRELLGEEAASYEKIRDTLDVWFDSGATHFTVMGGPQGRERQLGSHGADLAFPADLYLEGSDQHRGWFHSSLLVACMMYGVPPYKALLTHGFVVDGQGRKMSKSLGNVIAPQKVSDSLGAEILRLWVAATDYSGELSISDEILKRVVESYRRIRNTLRFLLANTADLRAAGGRMAGNRSVCGRAHRAHAKGCAGSVRRLRVPSHRRSPADVLLRRPGRLLSRRPQGPALYLQGRFTRAAFGAKRAASHHAVPAEADGADPFLHR